MTQETVFENDFYRVDINREEQYEQYQVVNKQHEVIEAREANLPQALILAKQFAMLLENGTWSRQLDEMYGNTTPSATIHSIKH